MKGQKIGLAWFALLPLVVVLQIGCDNTANTNPSLVGKWQPIKITGCGYELDLRNSSHQIEFLSNGKYIVTKSDVVTEGKYEVETNIITMTQEVGMKFLVQRYKLSAQTL